MKYIHKLLVLALLLCVWQICSSELVPSPKESLVALYELATSGALHTGITHSLYRYAIGLFLGVVAGTLVGFAFGLLPRVAAAFDPVVSILRPISPIAWTPLVVIVFGIGDKPTVFIIAYAVFFPVLLLAVKALHDVPKELIAVAKNFGASRMQIFTGVIFPSSCLTLISSLKLAASLAWINLVVGEMLGSQTGLGYLIIDARNQLRIDSVLAVICVIGCIGWLINGFFHMLERRISRRFGYDKDLKS